MNIRTEPPDQVAQKAPSSSSENFGYTSIKVGDKTIKGKPPRKNVHKVHTAN